MVEIMTKTTVFDRKKLLEITAALIQETYDRVSGDRFRPREGDRERLAYLRTLTELINVHASLLKASQAPAYAGLPREPTEDDIALEEARKAEFRDLEWSLVSYPRPGKAVRSR